MTKTKPSTLKYPGRGLVNPDVAPSKRQASAVKNATPVKRYRTHIPEPRWQRIISLVIIACLVAFELWFWLLRRH